MKASLLLYIAGSVSTAVATCACALESVRDCLVLSSLVASPYCSSFLGIPAVTATDTIDPIETVTVTSSSLETITIGTTVETTVYSTSSATSTLMPARKRDIAPTPACLIGQTLPDSQISNACSCLLVPTSSTTVTTTAPTATVTGSTFGAVSLDTVFTTLTTTTTAVVESLVPACTATVISPTSDSGAFFHRFYYGEGFIENEDNPGDDFPGAVFSTTLPGTTASCAAIQNCADISYNAFSHSFDLHFIPGSSSPDVWICTSYFDNNDAPDPASYFNVPSNTTEAYGFTFFD